MFCNSGGCQPYRQLNFVQNKVFSKMCLGISAASYCRRLWSSRKCCNAASVLPLIKRRFFLVDVVVFPPFCRLVGGMKLKKLVFLCMCLRWVLRHYNCSDAAYFSVSGAELTREGKWKEVLLNAENPVLLSPRSIVVFSVKRVQLNKCVM